MTDREDALFILTRVAAELVRHDGLPDPDDERLNAVAAMEARRLVKDMHHRGREIVKAIELLRKDAK